VACHGKQPLASQLTFVSLRLLGSRQDNGTLPRLAGHRELA
jgi:hypothetical protein